MSGTFLRLLRRNTIYVIAFIVICLAIGIPWYLFLNLPIQDTIRNVYKNLPVDQEAFKHLGDYLNPALWFQVLIALFTMILSSGAIISVLFLFAQIRKQHEQEKRELYRPLISYEMQSSRRFLAHEDVQSELNELNKTLDYINTTNNNANIKIYINMLEGLRKNVRHISGDIELPLLNGKKASLDHIEAIINEYNWLSQLIADGALRQTFVTRSTGENFQSTFARVRALIRLRQKISPDYASHFCEHCTGKPKLDP